MTEKEKMLRGELYDVNHDAQLREERRRCRKLLGVLNSPELLDFEKRREVLSWILGRMGANAVVESPFHCDYGYNVEVGENFYINVGGVMLDEAPLRFGDNVFIGPGCGFYTAGHPLDVELRNAGIEYARPITVGNNVWIGGNVTVVPGVTIGDNCVIGAGSVVTRDIPSGSLAVGNPCRVIRKI